MVLSTAALAALPPRADERPRPARYALELRPEQDPRAVADDVTSTLPEFGPTVTPISPSDHRVLVLELADRTLQGTEPARAFAAGYALADDFDLRTAEPDLPTPFFPEEDPPPAGVPVEEAFRFPPGCWVDAEDGLPDTWAVNRIKAPEAWQFAVDAGRPARGRGVIIAQLDTGLVAHVELVGVPRQGDYDVLDHDTDPTDPLTGANPGHGMGTASVAVSPESLQVAGSAPEATLMPIRAITSVIEVSQVSVAEAINRAVDEGADVISMSLGGVPAAALERAVSRAVAADIIVLAAAGNCVRTVVWPARYDDCIAVAGTNAADAMWKGTCRGPAVDISAPAQNVYKAATSSFVAVEQGQGTSFAVALVAGVAGLWLAYHGRADVIAAARARGETVQGMLLRLLRATARRPQGWNTSEMGAGIVDARALLAADLDLGRDRESVQPPHPLTEPESAVAGLVAETVGVDAVPDPDLDWRRYGPELATVLLEAQLAASAGTTDTDVGTGTARNEGTAPPRPTLPVSESLAEAIGNPRLRDHLGLDDEPPAEAGEVQPQ